MKYEFTVDGLKLPTLNKVLRMYWRERHDEMKRTRKAVMDAAMYSAGIVNPTPLSKAHVSITAYGPYQRRDSDGTVPKFCLDALVAKRIVKWGKTVGREWGCLLDDSRAVIGDLEFKTVEAKEYKVEVQVHEV